MLIKGECLRHVTTMNFTVHGEPHEWTLSVTGPGTVTLERTAYDTSPYGLLDEMLTEAFRECYIRYPERKPPPLPKPSALRLLRRQRASR